MLLVEFENMLKQAMGLDAASIGSRSIARAVQKRLGECKLEGLREYWKLVSTSESERQELIEAVVVPETWFFRDREAFTGLVRIVQQDCSASRAQSPLRLLSLPSSTGEEAYSIVMALLDAGLTVERFRVDGIDISQRALALAERAVYGKNSFRGKDLDFRERYFEARAKGYRLRDHVRRQVRFQAGNLFSADFMLEVESYDVVFCRNLLIYFDQATQKRAIKILERLLRPQGVLFVAPSETGLLLSHKFISGKPTAGVRISQTVRECERKAYGSSGSSQSLFIKAWSHDRNGDKSQVDTGVFGEPTIHPQFITGNRGRSRTKNGYGRGRQAR